MRPAQKHDLPAMADVIAAVDLFPAELLGPMAQAFFDAPDPSGEFWLVAEDHGRITALAYTAPERMTQGTWNMLLIAVDPNHQRQGLASRLLATVEHEVALRQGRLVLIETSGLAAFEGQRIFYRGRGYQQIARLPDFYEDGNDKIVFQRRLAAKA